MCKTHVDGVERQRGAEVPPARGAGGSELGRLQVDTEVINLNALQCIMNLKLSPVSASSSTLNCIPTARCFFFSLLFWAHRKHAQNHSRARARVSNAGSRAGRLVTGAVRYLLTAQHVRASKREFFSLVCSSSARGRAAAIAVRGAANQLPASRSQRMWGVILYATAAAATAAQLSGITSTAWRHPLPLRPPSPPERTRELAFKRELFQRTELFLYAVQTLLVLSDCPFRGEREITTTAAGHESLTLRPPI